MKGNPGSIVGMTILLNSLFVVHPGGKQLLTDGVMSIMVCENRERNLEYCNCSWPSCPRQGMCCECVRSHRLHGELPACFFPNDVEKSYDRSIARFISTQK